MTVRYDRLFVPMCISAMILFQGCGKKEIVYWDKARDIKKYEISYRKGEIHGLATWWYNNGSKQLEAEYDMGKLEGQSVRWYFNGQKESVEEFHNNLLNGFSVKWDEDGNKTSEAYYVNDTLHGSIKEWYPSGQIKMKGEYDKGKFNGYWEYFNQQGVRVGEGKFEKGSGLQKGYYLNGSLKRIITYRDNMKHGDELWFDEKKDTIRKIIYEYGEVVENELFK